MELDHTKIVLINFIITCEAMLASAVAKSVTLHETAPLDEFNTFVPLIKVSHPSYKPANLCSALRVFELLLRSSKKSYRTSPVKSLENPKRIFKVLTNEGCISVE